MNEVATRQQPPAPIVEFKRNLTGLIEGKELALPSNVSAEAFKNAAVVAAQDNPQILQCDMQSVFKSIRTLAAAGLVPDGREAALVPFNTKENGKYVKKCQAMPMVFGLVKMARRSGDVRDIRAHLVYQKEIDTGAFTYIVGDEERLEHQPILFGERGDPVAVYAIARLKDGTLVREFMSADEVDKIRRTGASQRVKQGDRYVVSDAPVGIWKDHSGEMWKKTVIRRLCKRLDLSAEDMRRIIADEDQLPIKDITPRDEPEAPRRNLAQKLREPEPTAEPEILPPADPDWPAVDGVPLDLDEAFPGSDEFTAGAKAFSAGEPWQSCPHMDDREKATNWCGGWFSAEQAAGGEE